MANLACALYSVMCAVMCTHVLKPIFYPYLTVTHGRVHSLLITSDKLTPTPHSDNPTMSFSPPGAEPMAVEVLDNTRPSPLYTLLEAEAPSVVQGP